MKRTLSYLALLVFASAVYLPATSEAATNATYYAVYCSQSDSKLALQSKTDTVSCNNSASPGIETTVNSLSTDPRGANDVTIVGADCYPDSPSAGPTGSIADGHIPCSGGPDASLTFGSTFKADKKAAAAKGSKKKSKSGSKKSGSSKTGSGGGSGSVSMTAIKPGGLPDTQATSSTVQNIIQIVFGIIGAFALMSMTASGLKYVTAAGDPGKTSEAKKGVIFALVGLMIAISAEAIVAYVIHSGAP